MAAMVEASRAAGRITKRVVDQAEAVGKPAFLWDNELRGFGLRVEPSSTKSFILRYRARSQGAPASRRFYTIGRYGALTVDQARDEAKRLLGAVALGQDPAAKPIPVKREPTFAEVVDLFLEEHVGRKRKSRTKVEYRALLKHYAEPTLGERRLLEIGRGDLVKLHSDLHEKPARANRLLAVIGSLYSFAERRELVPELFNPARRIERYKEDRRERFLTAGELERLGAALDEGETVGLPWAAEEGRVASKHLAKPENRRTLIAPEAAAAIRLLIFTGARLREVLDLRWEHVDQQRGLLLLPDSKTGRKTVVLNGAALGVVAGLPRLGPYVIPGRSPDRPRADLKKPWNQVCRRAELQGVRLHDLRHTFASVGAGASLGLPIVGKLLGHSQPQTTARYAHLDADPLRRASDLIGGQLAAALRGTR